MTDDDIGLELMMTRPPIPSASGTARQASLAAAQVTRRQAEADRRRKVLKLAQSIALYGGAIAALMSVVLAVATAGASRP